MTTPLITAISGPGKAAEKNRRVRDLLAAGAEIEARDADGWSALDHAVHGSAIPLIRLLIKKGADPNGRDPQGRTPLMKLDQKVSKVYKVVTTLVELGADPNARCARGRTPMMVAALAADHLGMACFALQAVKARVDLQDDDGETAISLCERHNRSMLRMLHRNLAEQTGQENLMPDRGVPDRAGYLPPG